MMQKYHIGTMSKEALETLKSGALEESNESTEPRETFLQPRRWTKATLTNKKIISWDTRIFTFALEHPKQKLGLPTGQHLMIKLADPSSKTNESIIRSYTPVSEATQEGTVDVLVKIYFDTPTCPGGKMTTALEKLPLGSTIECKGPTGRFEYRGNGKVLISGKERHVRSFRMICGGSGITPIFQVLRAVMQDQNDPTPCVVLDGNKTEEDILCRTELDAFVAMDQQKCRVVHILNNPSESWTGLRGRVSEELLREFAMPEEESMVLICGPEPMVNVARRLLVGLGWDESNLHCF